MNDLTRRFFFVLIMLIVYRIGTYIPLPGVNAALLTEVVRENSEGMLGMFYMLTGVPPFSDVPKEHVMMEHLRGMLEWPSDVNPSISQEVSRLIWRVAAREPEKRPRSASQLSEELGRIEEKLRASVEFGPEEQEQPASEAASQSDE